MPLRLMCSSRTHKCHINHGNRKNGGFVSLSMCTLEAVSDTLKWTQETRSHMQQLHPNKHPLISNTNRVFFFLFLSQVGPQARHRYATTERVKLLICQAVRPRLSPFSVSHCGLDVNTTTRECQNT